MMKYLCWFLLGDPRAGQQSVQNSGMFTSHKVLASFCIYLFIKYHHVNVSQGRIVRIFFFCLFSIHSNHVHLVSLWYKL